MRDQNDSSLFRSFFNFRPFSSPVVSTQHTHSTDNQSFLQSPPLGQHLILNVLENGSSSTSPSTTSSFPTNSIMHAQSTSATNPLTPLSLHTSNSSSSATSSASTTRHTNNTLVNANNNNNDDNNDNHASHTTAWRDVNVLKFCAYTTCFSTIENALFYPFFVLKTREQADRGNFNPFSSSMRTLRQILAKGGVTRGLYRGFWLSNISALPAYAVYMGFYTKVKDTIQQLALEEQNAHKHGTSTSSLFSSILMHPNAGNILAPFIAGIVADGASIGLYVPGDVIVQRLQMENSPYKGFADAFITILRNEGYKGFFRGFGATFFTSGLASAVWWVSYENMKQILYQREQIISLSYLKSALFGSTNNNNNNNNTSPSTSMLDDSLYSRVFAVNRLPQVCSGFFAGTITSILINPLDVVKTRIQTQDITLAANPTAHTRYKHMLHGLFQLYRDEGARGYIRGIMPKLVSRGPLSAASSILYEMVLYLSKD